MKFSGIDLHSNNSVVLISDEADRIVYQKRLPNDLAQILAALEPHRDELVGVVIESTYNWYWLVDGLMDAGYRVHLANPSGIRKYEGLKYSGDVADAAYLAHLLRLGLLAEGYIYPREERGARDLARKRLQLVRYRTAQILSIEGILMRQTGARMKSESVKGLTAEQVEEFGFAPDVALAVEANRAVSQTLGQQIEALEQRLQERVRLRAEFKLLKTVPGIGEWTSAVGSMNHIAFNVPEERFLEYRAKLKAKGVRVSPILDHDDSEFGVARELHPGVFVRSFYFQDPDGILLEFACWRRAMGQPGGVRHEPKTAAERTGVRV